ncbi:MAG: RNA polymerase sigma factor [Dokdonella sp.]|uniref:RNA polymerase sigma factor n=1 Tax=Dokdonella sp. TaxID=2291710 RepID=UPI001B607FB6|nr:RNA polymerase sigma factor [Dokdonella sp.]MBP6326755.1 RNA polymerase sigma factor [Dokdonella sp.]MBP6330724.1 RNA polymerase sigma factor [Dokdonella sp.]HNV07210.1 RNA polymerase sigma factor [Dokdonella sp.]HPW03426.1 RNA polymerase sigma factor [Dokdonella sp.]HQV47699.1 RNA polymerase sigma factor [Dokdonella sp.]
MLQTLPNPSALDDPELAGRIADGDALAMQVVMRRYNQRLFRAARSILKDDSEAEEAVQDGWLRAFRAMHTFRGEASLSTWLTRIVSNEALGRVRKSSRRAEIIPIESPATEAAEHELSSVQDDPDHAPENTAMRAEIRRLIERKIDSLPDAFRSVFVLRALEHMSVEEVAQSLGINEATVRTRYFRARGLLREELALEVDVNMENAYAFAGARCDRIVANVLMRMQDPASGGYDAASPKPGDQT